MNAIDNERTKLLANALDRASTACFTIGILTPSAGYFYNVANVRGSMDASALFVGLSSWLFAVIVLHCLARRLLKGLKP